MNELLAVLMTVAASMAQVGAPEKLPTVELIDGKELQVMACGKPEKCRDVHFHTDPHTNVIYVSKAVDMTLTFAKAELFREVSRYVLTQNKIYSPLNPCTRNVEIEAALKRMEIDYIYTAVQKNEYLGAGVPKMKDLPEHIFHCVPEESTNVFGL